MKRYPRKAKAAAKPIVDDPSSSEESDSFECEQETIPRTFSEFMEGKVDQVLEEEGESSASDFEDAGKKRKRISTSRPVTSKKKLKLSTRPKRDPSPDVPSMSDDDHEEERADDLTLFEKPKKPLRRKLTSNNVKTTALPNTITIEVPTGPTTLHLNLRDLLSLHTDQRTSRQELDGPTLLGAHSPAIERAETPESFADMRTNPKYACFMELEPDLRNRIYRSVLVKSDVVKFNPAPDLSRTAAILRTNKQIHHEATGILYGENAFHLDRTEKPRGNLYTAWKEVGYKDMRRFLETIGPRNLAKMRFLSISFTDAVLVYSPELSSAERRYLNDPVVYHILKLIGESNAVLEKLVVSFGGRSSLDWDSGTFIRAFTTIKCHQLLKVCRWHHTRISLGLFTKMKDFMEIPMPTDVDPNKQRAPLMHHEIGGGSTGCPYRCPMN